MIESESENEKNLRVVMEWREIIKYIRNQNMKERIKRDIKRFNEIYVYGIPVYFDKYEIPKRRLDKK